MTDKSLGQHWLKDKAILREIVDSAEISSDDTVLEVGPGLGTLTSQILRQSKRVVAVEFDPNLARKLPGQFPGKDLEVINEDILKFDLSSLPKNYKVVANIPYYITAKIVEKFLSADNQPSRLVLLVQKEVAQRICAQPGEMSLLALNAQVYAKTSLGIEVPRQYFTPPPKVDSQVVILDTFTEPLVENDPIFWRVARAGFSEKRKKLRSSISAGLAISKSQAEELLDKAGIDPNLRAQDLSIDDWINLAEEVK
ncbi:ribosomal RNA small subunit methyltransferase A [Candidatus Saccharibacteria bacterium]|nr:MAG: ribosomal RNA small subunit methyltransferase A [Candidatus Saccharibacteria bacterium]